jgi:hypothetical protein
MRNGEIIMTNGSVASIIMAKYKQSKMYVMANNGNSYEVMKMA